MPELQIDDDLHKILESEERRKFPNSACMRGIKLHSIKDFMVDGSAGMISSLKQPNTQ